MKHTLTAAARIGMALLLAMTTLFATLAVHPTQAHADDLTATAYGDITRLVAPESVNQGIAYSVTFDFEIAAYGIPFKEGDTFTFDTNLGDLFTITGEKTLEVRNTEGVLVALVNGAPDTVTVTIKEGAAGQVFISGSVTTPAITANDVGATEDTPVTKTLWLGDESANIVFNKPASVGTDWVDEPDWNQLWKNAWDSANNTRMTTAIEVNPLGNIDLYRSTNSEPVAPTAYKNFFVYDEIPENGQIDLTSMNIYAVINTVAQAGPGNTHWNEGDLYAQRTGTSRLQIDRVSHDSDRVRIFMITQNPGETKEQFKQRILSKDLQWGVYTEFDENGLEKQTLMMNFGDLGDPDDNNGIMFNDFLGTQADDKIRSHQELFGPDGATGGNVVSYYVQFDATYPHITGDEHFQNYAGWETASASGPRPQTSGGNWSSGEEKIDIVNGAAAAQSYSGEVTLKVVDEDNPSIPIVGAQFKVQIKRDGTYVDTPMVAQTDENGELSFPSLAQGDWRLVQLASAPGYMFDNNTYSANKNAVGPDEDPGTISNDGEFSIRMDNEYDFTVHALATNAREGYHVSYEFTSADGANALPDEVMALLPQDDATYPYGSAVEMKQPAKTRIDMEDGAHWQFEGYRATGGYNAASGTIEGDITFIGMWRHVEPSIGMNIAPTISAEDVVIWVGDPYDVSMHRAKAQDHEDGDLTGSIVADISAVDNMMPGVYTVAFKVSDSQNATAETTATVTVLPVYSTSYEFVSADPEHELPNAVLTLLPSDENVYHNGDLVTASNPAQVQVAVEDEGVWSFEGWDASTKTVTNADVTFTGTWSFSPYSEGLNMMPTISAEDVVIWVGDPYDVSMHRAKAQDHEDGDLTGSIVADTSAVDNTTPGEYTVAFTVSDKQGATAKTTATVTVLPKYSVAYQFASADPDRTLPDQVMALLPSDSASYKDGASVSPVAPSSLQVAIEGEGTWTFEGWNPGSAVIDGASVLFTGTWSFSPEQPTEEPDEPVTPEEPGDVDDPDGPDAPTSDPGNTSDTDDVDESEQPAAPAKNAKLAATGDYGAFALIGCSVVAVCAAGLAVATRRARNGR